MKKGPIWSEDKRTRIPEKEVVHNTMEGMIHHFKFFMTGFDVPEGEAYTQFEGYQRRNGFLHREQGRTARASHAHSRAVVLALSGAFADDPRREDRATWSRRSEASTSLQARSTVKVAL